MESKKIILGNKFSIVLITIFLFMDKADAGPPSLPPALPQLESDKVNKQKEEADSFVIIGPNSIGKSTLLKILVNKIFADLGNYEWGYETQVSYFAQDHHELLNESVSVIDWLSNQIPTENDNTLHTILGQLLFRKDEVNKNILNLSGGEGARLLLAKIILEESNILVLYEPTNHLDIESKDMLKKSSN